ncbi:hypothetical protein [Nocardia flavorosea]|nr:hypothetical protein [Nocardia flavorosea]
MARDVLTRAPVLYPSAVSDRFTSGTAGHVLTMRYAGTAYTL